MLTALKRIALPDSWLRARPKRMRFQIFCSPGKLVHNARQVLLRVSRLREQLAQWLEAWKLCRSRPKLTLAGEYIQHSFGGPVRELSPEARHVVLPARGASLSSRLHNAVGLGSTVTRCRSYHFATQSHADPPLTDGLRASGILYLVSSLVIDYSRKLPV